MATLLALSGLSALAQTSADPQPIYRVTVVSRTLQAINYEHRSGPTKIDFEGTVLLPKAKSDATVESKRGRISIDAKFLFGTQFEFLMGQWMNLDGFTRNLPIRARTL